MHFKLLRGAVGGSGGVEVKNLGDGLMVMYSSASRALAGAVGMQQAIEHHNLHLPPNRSAVRIGISTGEANEEDGDYFGDPVVQAARLCAEASGGEILAADLVRLHVGRSATHTFVERGPLASKGLPEPVTTVEVLWEPRRDRDRGAAAWPSGRCSRRCPVWVLRSADNELASLHEARKLAHSTKRAQLVLVTGEAGMGKHRARLHRWLVPPTQRARWCCSVTRTKTWASPTSPGSKWSRASPATVTPSC